MLIAGATRTLFSPGLPLLVLNRGKMIPSEFQEQNFQELCFESLSLTASSDLIHLKLVLRKSQTDGKASDTSDYFSPVKCSVCEKEWGLYPTELAAHRSPLASLSPEYLCILLISHGLTAKWTKCLFPLYNLSRVHEQHIFLISSLPYITWRLIRGREGELQPQLLSHCAWGYFECACGSSPALQQLLCCWGDIFQVLVLKRTALLWSCAWCRTTYQRGLKSALQQLCPDSCILMHVLGLPALALVSLCLFYSLRSATLWILFPLSSAGSIYKWHLKQLTYKGGKLSPRPLSSLTADLIWLLSKSKLCLLGNSSFHLLLYSAVHCEANHIVFRKKGHTWKMSRLGTAHSSAKW